MTEFAILIRNIGRVSLETNSATQNCLSIPVREARLPWYDLPI